MGEKSKDFEAIYQGAIYVVFYKDREIKFRIGEANEEIDSLLVQYGSERYAFLTAYNPLSTELPEQDNQRRQVQLKDDLDAAGIKSLEGYGGSEDGSWQPEPSLFLLDVSKEMAVFVARKYGQHAIVFGERGSVPQLVWCQST